MEWQRRYGKQGLVIIAFSHDYPQMLKKFAEGFGINYTLARWEPGKMPEPLRSVTSYPTSLLIDRHGRLRAFVFGPHLQDLEKALKAALKEQPKSEKPAKPAKPSTSAPKKS